MLPLVLGTLLTLLFIALLLTGRGATDMLTPLSGDAYPLKSVYLAGFSLHKILRPRGKTAKTVREYCNLYYGRKYGEYYSMVAWAQAYSLGLLFFTVAVLLAGLLPDLAAFILLIGLVLSAYTCWYFLTYAKQKVKSRQEECSAELPSAISKMALLVNSGVILHEAWYLVAYGKEGAFYSLMREACESMDNGLSDSAAIYNFAVASDDAEVKKFASALVQSMERGGRELSFFLANQSSEMWNHHRQTMLQKGEKAAGALLAPIALMFAGVMLVIIVSAVQSFSL